MAWRSVVITQPSRLMVRHHSLVVEQGEGTVQIPMEDIAVLLIDHVQVSLSVRVLSACAEWQIAVITVGQDHHPNGVLLAYLPHSRALKVMRSQLALGLPRRKQLWQAIVRQKIRNQAAVLARHGQPSVARRLEALAREVRSGDTGQIESQASQVYFPALFGQGYTRQQERHRNATLNYGYAIVRAALARSLVAYGFMTAFGLHHASEQNAFNLADDLIESFRPLVDAHVLSHFPQEPEGELDTAVKGILVGFLHEDIALWDNAGCLGHSSVLTAVDEVVMGLARHMGEGPVNLVLPRMLERATDE